MDSILENCHDRSKVHGHPRRIRGGYTNMLKSHKWIAFPIFERKIEKNGDFNYKTFSICEKFNFKTF